MARTISSSATSFVSRRPCAFRREISCPSCLSCTRFRPRDRFPVCMAYDGQGRWPTHICRRRVHTPCDSVTNCHALPGTSRLSFRTHARNFVEANTTPAGWYPPLPLPPRRKGRGLGAGVPGAGPREPADRAARAAGGLLAKVDGGDPGERGPAVHAGGAADLVVGEATQRGDGVWRLAHALTLPGRGGRL